MKRRNREIEYVTMQCGDDDMRYVFYRPKPTTKIGRFFTPWRQLRKAYKCIPGMTGFFYPDEFRELRDVVEYESDLIIWKAEQKKKNQKAKERVKSEWDEVLRK